MNIQTFAEQIAVVQARHHEREKELLELLREIKEMLGYCPYCWANSNEPCGDGCKLGNELRRSSG